MVFKNKLRSKDTLNEAHIRNALKDVLEGKENIVADIHVADKGQVFISLNVDPSQGSALEPMRQNVERIVTQIKGVKTVSAVLTASTSKTSSNVSNNSDSVHHKSIASDSNSVRSNIKAAKALDPHGMNKNPKLDLPIKHIIAVASGKGGVGKSTVASNLAVSLAHAGMSVGLLDADIYGPSQPRMMGLCDQKPKNIKGRIQPLHAHSVKVMSIGFMIDNEAPLVWRGPMVQSAIYQMLRDVDWVENAGEEGVQNVLDVLVVDMPPGTGDAQLTMAQKVPLSGAVIVSTPQDIALLDARKAVGMFKKVNVPILGMIENMSYFNCKNCDHENHIFGHGGAKNEAVKLNVEFLGSIPLNIETRIAGDGGTPICVGENKNSIFQDIADKIIASL